MSNLAKWQKCHPGQLGTCTPTLGLTTLLGTYQKHVTKALWGCVASQFVVKAFILHVHVQVLCLSGEAQHQFIVPNF